MKTLCSVIFTSLIAGSLSCISAQSDEYVIESFQDEYIALTDYQSVAKLAFGNPIFEVALPLNFQFPFYGAYYDTIIYNTDAWGSLTNNQDVALLLMDFTRGYAWDWVVDTLNITSDIRFAHVLTNSIQAFVLQYTKMGFFADPVEEFDPSMNFQLWFFENGIVEVHFGEMNMNGTPVYDPGEGFYCYSTSGGVDMSEVCGPHMGISDPLNEEDAIALSGSWDNYEVVGDQYAVLNTLPPVGWVIRFEPRTLGLFEPDYQITEFSINPNPAISYIMIPDPGSYVTICDFSGKVKFEGIVTDNKLSVADFPPGMYFVRIASGSGSSIGKFYKS